MQCPSFDHINETPNHGDQTDCVAVDIYFLGDVVIAVAGLQSQVELVCLTQMHQAIPLAL
jgi:hypothetical protein